MEEIVYSVVDAASAEARIAMRQYFDELDRRFIGGFDSTHSFEEANISFNPPNGEFVIASAAAVTIGCGAIQYVDADTAEIKRMWIDPQRRGTGFGRRLLAHLEAEVWRLGRTRVVLDTNETLTEAIAMYERLGYVAIEAYNDNPYAHHWFEKLL